MINQYVHIKVMINLKSLSNAVEILSKFATHHERKEEGILKNFSVGKPYEFQAAGMFGSGWTNETIGRIKGWMAKRVGNESGFELWVIGRADKPGAASVMIFPGDEARTSKYDLAMYDNFTGPEIFNHLKSGEQLEGDAYRTIKGPLPSGWFLKYIDEDGNLL
jgi:hypothetical protein